MNQQLTYETWEEELADLDVTIDDEYKGSLQVIKHAYETYGDEVVYACSFGAEGIVLIDLISKVKPDANVVFLDTDFHFKETYELIEKMRRRYPQLNIKMQKPELTPEEQVEKYGDELWKSNPDKCCNIRKILPLQRALSGATAWISGLRREQSPSRRNTNFLNKDNKFHSIKVCPLIYWTWEDVWDYINGRDLPYNPLHEKGFPSIGCEQCTLPTNNLKDLRAGRWANLEKTECGLHY